MYLMIQCEEDGPSLFYLTKKELQDILNRDQPGDNFKYLIMNPTGDHLNLMEFPGNTRLIIDQNCKSIKPEPIAVKYLLP